MRQHKEAGSDRPTLDIVQEATSEIRSPLAYGTIIALLAIVPVAVMEGRPGAFFEPLALSYALAVVAALVVALTVTPALSMVLFSLGSPGQGESKLAAALRSRYDRGLARITDKARPIMIGAAALVVIGALAFALQDKSVIPSFKDRDVLVSLDAEPGTSNTRMTEIATQVSRELRSLPGVDNVGAHVGRAVAGDQRQDVNSGEVWVTIDSGADYDKTYASIGDAVRGVQGVRSDVITYSEQKIRDVGALREGQNLATGEGIDVLTGSDQPLTVRMFGQDLDVLRREAAKVRSLMAQTDGVVDPQVAELTTQPNVEVRVDVDKARKFGIKPGDVRRAQATLIQGLTVGSVFEDQKVFEVVVKGTPNLRRSVADVRSLLIDTPAGGQVRLDRIADVEVVRNVPISIPRDSVSRYLDVKADVSGRSLDSVASDLEDRLNNAAFPIEYHAEVLQQTSSSEVNLGLVAGAALAVLIAIFLLMQAATRGWRLAVLAFAMLPVALSGGAIAALIDGGYELGSLVGFLALLGIASRNLISLIRRYQDLERYEGEKFGPELVARGARERLAPMLTTALSLGLAALVFVIMGVQPGLEVINPMAVVILGGLVTTTAVSLIVLPVLYLRFGGQQPTLSPEEELMHRWVGIEPAPATAGEPVAADGHGSTAATTQDGGESSERSAV
jgi:Cu/Ag efflux pump CusA